MAAQILVRSLGPLYDPLWGQGQGNFLADLDAVAQIIGTRLRLFQAEWWADLEDGTPYWQSILGKGASSNTQAINLILTQRILATPFVTSVSNISSSFDPNTRQYFFNITVQTQFGLVSVSNYPVPQPQGLPQ